ncbi:hypothetical protein OROHE_025190 [Orobanche hederae]
MASRLSLLGRLAKEANSNYVKDMMLVQYAREVRETFADEEDLRSKATEISERVNHRYRVLRELEVLPGSDSAVESIANLRRLQMEELAQAARLLFMVMQKHARLHELLNFIQRLEGMEY